MTKTLTYEDIQKLPGTTKVVTLEELIEVIERNGLSQVKGSYVRYESEHYDSLNRKVVGACAMGQAAINLGVSPGAVVVDRDREQEDKEREPFHYECPIEGCDKYSIKAVEVLVIHLNDKHLLTYTQIADELRKYLAPAS